MQLVYSADPANRIGLSLDFITKFHSLKTKAVGVFHSPSNLENIQIE